MDLERIEGCLLGVMVGDALGLPREALSRKRAQSMFPGTLRHRFLLGRGMVSDDTEHTWFVAQALLASGGKPQEFARALAWKLRLWFLTLPAGMGVATLRAILKLWLGFSPESSGVWSAGNGPAMRSSLLGVYYATAEAALREHVRRSTRMTHTDPRAERGALAVAWAAAYAATHDRRNFCAKELITQLWHVAPEGSEASLWVSTLARAIEDKWDAERFLEAHGCLRGVTGYVYHTVPAALWAWLADPFDFRGGMERVISLGGDADTTAAIFGGVCGALVGREGIPQEWISGLWEFPRSVEWTRRLARRLHETQSGSGTPGPLPVFWPLIPLRNAIFLAVVLAHGVRRLFPPY